jgi:hypothetical protein
MEVFIINITSFPVVIYTFLLTIIVLYWLLALFGALDIEIFDTDLDIDVDADLGPDVNAESVGMVAGFMLKWGLIGVPVTVVISGLVLISWVICYMAVLLILPWIPTELLKSIVGLVLLVVSFALSIPVTAWCIKPMKGIFVSHSAVKKSALIGLECEVKTGTVNSKFGQAELQDGGAGMLLGVRCQDDEIIKKGDRVVLVKYDSEEDVYWVTKNIH